MPTRKTADVADIDLFATALEIQSFCVERGWECCIIGGLAVLRWGQLRVTRDVDLTLLTGFGNESYYVEELLKHFKPRNAEAAKLALSRRVLLLNSSKEVGIDISFGALPFEQLAVERSSMHKYAPRLSLRTCSAEDLIVMKLFASRPQDVRDAEGVALKHGKKIDWGYVTEQLTPLAELKEEPEILDTLRRIRKLA
jgi:hypothetical protein